MSDEKRRAFRYRKSQGMSEETRNSLKSFNEAQKDWTATCRLCGETLTGTLEDLRQHRLAHVPKSS